MVRYILLGQATYGDGRFYWAYLRSMVVRMDLDVAKELPHAWNHRSNNSEPPENESGAFSYPEQSMGYSVIVFPWIFGLHTLLLLLKEIGIPVVANGYSDVYQISTGILLIGCVSIAFFLLYRLMITSMKPRSAVLALLFIWLTTNLFFYTSVDVLNTHPISFFLSSVLFSLFFYKKKYPLLSGFLLGLMFTNRTNDPAMYAPLLLWSYIHRKDFQLADVLLLFVGGAVGALPQLLVWQVQHGSMLPTTSEGHYWIFNSGFFLHSFYSLFILYPQGLVYTAPIALLGLWGFWRYAKPYRHLLFGVAILTGILVFWRAPLGGESYGIRFFIQSFPIAAYGLGLFIDKSRKFGQYIILLLLLTLAAMMNMLLFLLTHSGGVQKGIDAEIIKMISSLL